MHQKREKSTSLKFCNLLIFFLFLYFCFLFNCFDPKLFISVVICLFLEVLCKLCYIFWVDGKLMIAVAGQRKH